MAGEGLNIRMVGEGEPAIIFVHGFGCSLDDWTAQFEALSPAFRCIALDLPGHGASARTVEPLVSTISSAVTTVKKQIGAGKVVLVGHSLGSKVVREAYCQSPEGIIGIVMIDGRYLIPGSDLLHREKKAIESLGFSAFIRRNFAPFFPENYDARRREYIIERAAGLDPEFGTGLYLDAIAWDPLRSEETLRQIKVPVLVLQSTYVNPEGKRLSIQPGITTPFMEIVERLIPASDIKTITGSGHFTMLDRPDAVNREIESFARRIASSPSLSL